MFLGYFDVEAEEQLFLPCKEIKVDLEEGDLSIHDRDGDEVVFSKDSVSKFYIIEEGGEEDVEQ